MPDPTYTPASFNPPTFNSSGYITSQVQVAPEQNPWTALAAESNNNLTQANTAAAGIPGMQQQMAQQQGAMSMYGSMTAPSSPSYPAMPNQYGLGSPPNYGLGSQNAPASGSTPQGNPFMLKGDALSR